MLIEKRNSPDINDIVTIKLASGEEVVGKLTEKTIDSVFLAKPVQIIVQPVGQQKFGLMFQPLLGSAAEATLQFPLSGLSVRPIKTGDDIARTYIQMTTGLVTARELMSDLQ